jgi:phosphonate transport system substrate-binding protein
MHKNEILTTIIIVVLVAALVAWMATTLTSSRHEDQFPEPSVGRQADVLVVGLVGKPALPENTGYLSFANYLAKNSEAFGKKRGTVLVAQSSSQMAKLMRQGKVDIFMGTPFPAYIVSKLAEAKPIANRWATTGERYRSIMFARKDSKIKTLNDLKGNVIELYHKNSTSGYFLPKSELLKRGFVLKEVKDVTEKVGSQEIGYYLTNDADQIIEDVIAGKIVAGGQAEPTVIRVAGTRMSELSIVLASIYVDHEIVVVSTTVPSDFSAHLESLLVKMADSSDGRDELVKIGGTKFTPIADPNAAFKGVSELAPLVENEIIREMQ